MLFAWSRRSYIPIAGAGCSILALPGWETTTLPSAPQTRSVFAGVSTGSNQGFAILVLSPSCYSGCTLASPVAHGWPSSTPQRIEERVSTSDCGGQSCCQSSGFPALPLPSRSFSALRQFRPFQPSQPRHTSTCSQGGTLGRSMATPPCPTGSLRQFPARPSSREPRSWAEQGRSSLPSARPFCTAMPWARTERGFQSSADRALQLRRRILRAYC